MSYTDPGSQIPTGGDPTGGSGGATPSWVNGPPPPNYPQGQPWPPPLPPGGSYGPNPGQIIFGNNPNTPNSTPPPITPGQTPQDTWNPATGTYGPATTNTPAPAATTPPPSAGPGSAGGPLSGSLTYNVPNTPPTPTALPTAPTFQAPTFNAPSLADAMADPGQQFRMQQGESALQNWAAAKGTLNDSGTAKALEDYGQASGQQGYADVWNRNYAAWQGALGAYTSTVVNPDLSEFQTNTSATQHANDMDYQNWWNALTTNQNNAKWFASQ